jgi:hypothetical protein
LLVVGQESFAQLTHHCAVLRVAMEGVWKRRTEANAEIEPAAAGAGVAGNGAGG